MQVKGGLWVDLSCPKIDGEPWEYDRAMYKRHNGVERLSRRLKGYRRIFSRFEKLDVMFIAFISFALIADGFRLCYLKRETGAAGMRLSFTPSH